MAKYDYVIVGAGFFGAVWAQQARENGQSALVIDRRPHLGGNCFSYTDAETGVNVHEYGTHIFHTNDTALWRYINRFTEFNRYQHRVLTMHRNRVYAMPINLGTINAFYGVNLTPGEVPAFLESKKDPIPNPQNLEEKAISLIGRDLYEAFIKGYTQKQWGCDPRELPASIITRLPVRSSFFDSYFDDRYQGIPIGGYTPIFERMLEGTPVELGVDYFDDPGHWRRLAKQVVYTGPLDRYFGYEHGRLSWRSVRFELERRTEDDAQGTSVMNYADLDMPHTRIHEPKHLHPESWSVTRGTVVIREYSQVNNDEPYYPVNLEADRALYQKYRALQEQERDVIFGGRLAEYKYYDMHQVIASALAKYKKAQVGEQAAASEV